MQILIVEDDTDLSSNLKAEFNAIQYFAEVAHDGFIAEKLLKRTNYDCIVMDINLPHINGYDLCKKFREYNNQTPIIILSAFDELDDKLLGFECGADDYLTKPFFFKELEVRVKALLKRKNTDSNKKENLLEYAGIVIDDQQKKVKRNGQEIDLTPKEYQILKKLVLAKGETVQKQSLLKEIWGYNFEANTNTLEVYINILRNKLDKPFDSKLIKTRVGFGYYLDNKA